MDSFKENDDCDTFKLVDVFIDAFGAIKYHFFFLMGAGQI